MISAVIFDRDGVLTQFDMAAGVAYFESLLPITVEDLTSRWQEFGDVHGFPRDLAEEKEFWRNFWESLADDLQLSLLIRSELHRIDYKRYLQPYADARPALLTAREHRLRTGVLSNFTLASLDASLTAVGLADLVDIACAAPVIGVSKPEAAAYETILSRLAVQPETCLFFDDEKPCIEGARKLGIHAYLVDRRLEQHDLANNKVKDLTALTDILKAYI